MRAAVSELVDLLQGRLDFRHNETSFSPHFSRGGLLVRPESGAGELLFYYNRRVSGFGASVLSLHGERGAVERGATEAGPLGFESVNACGGADRVAFADADLWVHESTPGAGAGAAAHWSVPVPGEEGSTTNIRYDRDTRVLLVRGRIPRTDPRDPEPTFPYGIALRLPDTVTAFSIGPRRFDCGETAETLADAPATIALEGAAAGQASRFAAAFAPGPADEDELVRDAARAGGYDVEECQARTVRWLEAATPDLRLPPTTKGLRRLYARCVWTLLSNTVRPHARFAPFRGCFPNRARYCCHYLWDSCFQSLGMSRFNPELAAEALRLLVALQEGDGKIPQFMCATWNRPGASQPPLIAWAGLRLFEEFDDRSLVEDLYAPLVRWNEWWFTARDLDQDNLPEYDEGLESGWDNSPRWDHGRTEPLDLNSFLLVQMRSLAEFARVLGRTAEERSWRDKAESHGRRIREYHWQADRKLFHDVAYDTHDPIPIVTPASFLPVWAGVRPEPADLDAMIDGVLLASEHLGGEIPFPVVARSEATYASGGWWRGPVWMNIAHLMLETLERTGRRAEQKDAMGRLLGVVERNRDPRELYDSESGEGLGAHELGWTASVAIRWIETLADVERGA